MIMVIRSYLGVFLVQRSDTRYVCHTYTCVPAVKTDTSPGILLSFLLVSRISLDYSGKSIHILICPLSWDPESWSVGSTLSAKAHQVVPSSQVKWPDVELDHVDSSALLIPSTTSTQNFESSQSNFFLLNYNSRESSPFIRTESTLSRANHDCHHHRYLANWADCLEHRSSYPLHCRHRIAFQSPATTKCFDLGEWLGCSSCTGKCSTAHWICLF